MFDPAVSWLEHWLNPKCVVFSGAVCALWYWLPPPQTLTLTQRLAYMGGLSTAAYTAMAHYDSWYDCNPRLKATGGGLSALTAPLKPPVGPDGRYS